MATIKVVDDCDCPNDCNGNHYTYSVFAKKLDVKYMCSNPVP